jgi:hypothetical protein
VNGSALVTDDFDVSERTIGPGGPPETLSVVASLPAVEIAIRDARASRDPDALERAAAAADTLAVGDGVVARRAASLAEAARHDAEAMRRAGGASRAVASDNARSRQWIWIVLVTAAIVLWYAMMAAGLLGDEATTPGAVAMTTTGT